jgi:hypothetical protein
MPDVTGSIARLPHGPVADALAGEMLVPNVGCSGCREKAQTIADLLQRVALLERHIADQDHLIGISEEFIEAYQADQTNREARRQAARRRRHLAPVPKGPATARERP